MRITLDAEYGIWHPRHAAALWHFLHSRFPLGARPGSAATRYYTGSPIEPALRRRYGSVAAPKAGRHALAASNDNTIARVAGERLRV